MKRNDTSTTIGILVFAVIILTQVLIWTISINRAKNAHQAHSTSTP